MIRFFCSKQPPSTLHIRMVEGFSIARTFFSSQSASGSIAACMLGHQKKFSFDIGHGICYYLHEKQNTEHFDWQTAGGTQKNTSNNIGSALQEIIVPEVGYSCSILLPAFVFRGVRHNRTGCEVYGHAKQYRQKPQKNLPALPYPADQRTKQLD